MGLGRGERLLYQRLDKIKTKFAPSNAGFRTLANKKFGCVIGNFIIATTTRKGVKAYEYIQ